MCVKQKTWLLNDGNNFNPFPPTDPVRGPFDFFFHREIFKQLQKFYSNELDIDNSTIERSTKRAKN